MRDTILKISCRVDPISKRAEVNDSAGVFAVLPKNIAKQFKSLGIHDDSDPHITVLYIGKVAKSKRKLLQEVVESVAKDTPPFEVELADKVSYFPPTESSDNCKVAKVAVKSRDLHKFHEALKKALKDADIKIEDNFPDYNPHVTLEYMEPPKKKYDDDVPDGSWMIDEIEIWGVGKNKKIKLNKKLSKRE